MVNLPQTTSNTAVTVHNDVSQARWQVTQATYLRRETITGTAKSERTSGTKTDVLDRVGADSYFSPLSAKRAPCENFAEFVRKSGQRADISVGHSVETDTIVSSQTRNPLRAGPLRPMESAVQTAKFGGLAQLGERLHGMQEVRGSTPLSSTSQSPKL